MYKEILEKTITFYMDKIEPIQKIQSTSYMTTQTVDGINPPENVSDGLKKIKRPPPKNIYHNNDPFEIFFMN